MDEGFKPLYQQSAVIPVFEGRVVLITAKKSTRWIIPKGHVENGFSPAESAAKEALEEAGLIGVVHPQQAGQFGYSKFGKQFSVEVYPLYIDTILDEWDEMHLRQRKLVTPAEAVEMVWHDELRRIISDFFAVN